MNGISPAPNTVLAGPSSGTPAAQGGYRLLLPADIPALAASKITSGVFPVSQLATAVPAWVKVATKTFTDLSTAGLTNDIEAFSLPAKTAIHGAALQVTTAFSGGTIATYTLSLGISGLLTKYVTAFSAASTGFALQASGIVLPSIESFSGATSIRLAAVSTIGNLNAATQGSVGIWLCLGLLP